MFYKILMQVGLIVILVGFFWNIVYIPIKGIKYKNDERWRFIEIKASKVVKVYQGIIMIGFGVILIVDRFYKPFQISFSVSDVILIPFILYFLQHGVELIALMYLDKKV